jgi:hypothetical protein
MTNERYRDLMNKKIDDPLTWIGNYFYNTGKYTVKGSPYCLSKSKDYKLHEWLMCYSEGCNTSTYMIGIGVERGYITKSKELKSGALDNVLCGRNSEMQSLIDFTVGVFEKGLM